jgi:hypothetical protein
MFRPFIAAAAVAAVVVGPWRASAADDAVLLRVFLRDGTSLVSYGEPARVGDRVVFSMPTAATPNPPLHLVNLAADRVDWDRTNGYATTARATHYIATQAENDYAALSNDITQALNDVALTADPLKRLTIVENARKTLAEWPQNHFNYRQTEVRQMLTLLDEAIADLKAASGQGRFDLALTAFVDPPTIVEPLMPPPTPREAIEQILRAAQTVDTAAERTSLLSSALVSLDRDREVLPAAWVASTRADTEAAIQAELRIDAYYRQLTTVMLPIADRRARAGDVRGLERLLTRIQQRDEALGGRRPDAVNALVAAVEEKLDAARRLQLARDRWDMRAPVFREYYGAITRPITLFGGLKPALENIKSLAGSSPLSLATTEHVVSQILKLAAEIVPPQEFVTAHALLVSAVQLAGNAAQIRREATLAGDMPRAWDASSAAAGALMLGARAESEMKNLLRRPQLR